MWIVFSYPLHMSMFSKHSTIICNFLYPKINKRIKRDILPKIHNLYLHRILTFYVTVLHNHLIILHNPPLLSVDDLAFFIKNVMCSIYFPAGVYRLSTVMTNQSCQEHFILLGFSDRPRLEQILFVFVLIFYLVTLVGNSVIILVSCLDPCLQTPMYFFLTNLSFLDLCFTTSSIPQLLFNLGSPDKTISYMGCAIQLFMFLGLGGTECVLLAVMAYDRFTAICKPLHYSILMHPQLCWTLVSVAWEVGLLNSLVMSPVTMKLPRCGRCRVKHFLCEMPALIKISCVDTVAVESTVFILSVIIVLVPLLFILISYSNIALAVLRIKSAAGRRKAFNTCGSHLTVVSLFYGNIIYMYMQPGNNSSQDQGKFLTLFYNLVTPMLNPVIYTLRNRDVKGALKRLVSRK